MMVGSHPDTSRLFDVISSGAERPSEAKAHHFDLSKIYGLKPVPFKSGGPAARLEVRGRVCKWACKPNSVEDDHSSRRRIAAPLKRPTRRFPTVPANRDRNPGERAEPARIRGPGLAVGFPPYLVLLRVGFTLPPPLQTARCALTAPFHPYPRR